MSGEVLTTSGAIFSACRTYRYSLWRTWSGRGTYARFIGLNPSTADETKDDPTIRRCIAFAKAWGYDGVVMLNLFAFRATSPSDMMKADDPVGPDNDGWLIDSMPERAVAAWGTHGTFMGRDRAVKQILAGRLYYLRLTKDGHPSHPLYLPGTLQPTKWDEPLTTPEGRE